MPSGTVKWFNATESYGLSLAAAKTFHIWAVEKTGLSDLREGGNGAP